MRPALRNVARSPFLRSLLLLAVVVSGWKTAHAGRPYLTQISDKLVAVSQL